MAAHVADGFIAVGDTVSFGATAWIRGKMGTDDFVDYCCAGYAVGEFAGEMIRDELLTLGAAKMFRFAKALRKAPDCPLPWANSFAAGTEVLTREGLRPIEELEAGDLVQSKDPVSGKIDWRPVESVFTTGVPRSLIALDVETADGARSPLRVTDEHPLWVEGRGWVDARHVGVGDRLKAADERALVVRGAESIAPGLSYNITVAGFHTYYAGEAGVWNHNSCGGGAGKWSRPPPNMSPKGAGRSGAFREAKRQSGVPVSQQPSRLGPNLDRRGNVQPGKTYEFDVPAKGGGTRTVKIRDDAGGHWARLWRLPVRLRRR